MFLLIFYFGNFRKKGTNFECTGWAKVRYTFFFSLQVFWMMTGNLSIEQRKWIVKQHTIYCIPTSGPPYINWLHAYLCSLGTSHWISWLPRIKASGKGQSVVSSLPTLGLGSLYKKICLAISWKYVVIWIKYHKLLIQLILNYVYNYPVYCNSAIIFVKNCNLRGMKRLRSA